MSFGPRRGTCVRRGTRCNKNKYKRASRHRTNVELSTRGVYRKGTRRRDLRRPLCRSPRNFIITVRMARRTRRSNNNSNLKHGTLRMNMTINGSENVYHGGTKRGIALTPRRYGCSTTRRRASTGTNRRKLLNTFFITNARILQRGKHRKLRREAKSRRNGVGSLTHRAMTKEYLRPRPISRNTRHRGKGLNRGLLRDRQRASTRGFFTLKIRLRVETVSFRKRLLLRRRYSYASCTSDLYYCHDGNNANDVRVGADRRRRVTGGVRGTHRRRGSRQETTITRATRGDQRRVVNCGGRSTTTTGTRVTNNRI